MTDKLLIIKVLLIIKLLIIKESKKLQFLQIRINTNFSGWFYDDETQCIFNINKIGYLYIFIFFEYN